MKKKFILFTILIAFAFIAACTCEPDTAPTQENNLADICTNYCSQTAVPPPEPDAPPVTVEPSVLPDKTIFSDPIRSVENAVIDSARNTITIKFQNNRNATITLPLTGSVSKYSKSECKNPQITATYKGENVKALVTEISNGDQFTVTWDCENLQEIPAPGTLFSADLTFDYKVDTGMIYSEIGTVTSKY